MTWKGTSTGGRWTPSLPLSSSAAGSVDFSTGFAHCVRGAAAVFVLNAEEEEDVSARKPRAIKVAWDFVKEYDRNKISDPAIFEDITQIMQNSLKDANLYSENVEQRLPTDLGYFKQSHVSIILLTVLMSGFATDSMISVYDSITRARRILKFRATFTSARSLQMRMSSTISGAKDALYNRATGIRTS